MFPEIVPKWFHSAPQIHWIHLSHSVDQYQWKVLHSNFLIKKTLYRKSLSLPLSAYLCLFVCLSVFLSLLFLSLFDSVMFS